MSFFNDLIKIDSGISSNRFLAIFIFSPALIVSIFLQLDISYVYVLSGLITALLIGNVISKNKNYGNK